MKMMMQYCAHFYEGFVFSPGVCDFPQNGSNADAVRRLFKKIIASDESGKWQMFLTALEKAGTYS